MTNAIVAVFDHYADADRVIQALNSHGLGEEAIGIIAHERGIRERLAHEQGHAAHAERDGNVLQGATVGGLGGFLFGLAALAIPGVGELIAAGTFGVAIASAAIGAGLGARVSGDLIKLLMDLGISEPEALVYAERVKQGGILITVAAPPEQRADVRHILQEAQPARLTSGESVS